ncbi:hypothetical protein H2200_012577 [Cladophialophora chaetospira]|uniref:Uncharacterized protein n=1 Tax=Cladophialophora chaetospira TaxID=386627 RepID=A0AA39CC31_9EURO|nr:hypothetical protein H2200_012577 [Cladophialophora chaetospira]
MGCCGSKQARYIANAEAPAVRSNPYGRPATQGASQAHPRRVNARSSLPSASGHTTAANSSAQSNRATMGTRASDRSSSGWGNASVHSNRQRDTSSSFCGRGLKSPSEAYNQRQAQAYDRVQAQGRGKKYTSSKYSQ